jgi:glycosyltransferase involved in cell wall biosynthesis
MTDDPITVSIIICTRNRAHSLGGTLTSLIAQSTKHSWEALLVDNASTDNTAEVIRAAAESDPHLRYLSVTRIGLGAARDAAWRQARGQIIAFTDDDCYLEADYIDRLVEAWADYPDAGAIGGRIRLHDPDDAPITIDERNLAEVYPARAFLKAGALHGANLTFWREVLETTGGFDPELGAGTQFPCEDIDAVAALVWAGYPARYDPRFQVSHHHGRKACDVPRIMEGYDRGRGAYFMKYILRTDSRAAYMSAWRDSLRHSYGRDGFQARRRELSYALRWLKSRREYAAMAVVAVAAPVMIAATWLRRKLS